MCSSALFWFFVLPRSTLDIRTSIICLKIGYVSKSIEKSLENKLFVFSKENRVVLLKNELFSTSVVKFLPNIRVTSALWKKTIYIRKTCVLTFNKKKKIFFQNRTSKKFNGGVSQKLIKWTTFGGWQKFLAEFSTGNFWNQPSENLSPK